MRQDLGVDGIDLMLTRRISCFTALERTFRVCCGRGGIQTLDTMVRSHML